MFKKSCKTFHLNGMVRNSQRSPKWVATLILGFFVLPAFAASPSLEDRVLRLEQMADTRQDYDLANRIEQLQDKVAQLQGQIEVLTNDVHVLTEQQRNMYKDLDERITKITNGASPANEGGVNESAAPAETGGELHNGTMMQQPSVVPSANDSMPSPSVTPPPAEPLIEQTVPSSH
jgi:TolA-binding protein